MFLFDPDRLRLGELKSATVLDNVLYLKLQGLKLIRIAYDRPLCAALELQRIAHAVGEGDMLYALDSDHRTDIRTEDEVMDTDLDLVHSETVVDLKKVPLCDETSVHQTGSEDEESGDGV